MNLPPCESCGTPVAWSEEWGVPECRVLCPACEREDFEQRARNLAAFDLASGVTAAEITTDPSVDALDRARPASTEEARQRGSASSGGEPNTRRPQAV
jgi:hypothetical protein